MTIKPNDDMLLIVIDTLQEVIPNNLTDCFDIDYLKLAQSFYTSYFVNQKFMATKNQLQFDFGDGQHFYTAKVELTDKGEPKISVCPSTGI